MPYMRRIIDLTTPDRMRPNEKRISNRYNRALPVVIAPWHNGQADLNHVSLAITKEISESGMSILTTTQLPFVESVFSILVDSEIASDIWFFQGTVMRESVAFGFGEYGIRINEFLNDSPNVDLEHLKKMIYGSLENDLAD